MNLIVDGLDVSVKDEGSGPVVLLLHGWKSELGTFDGLAAALVAQNYRVIRPNLPGFGGSQIPPLDWGVPEYASFVQSYLEKMKATELLAVVGHSMGARIAMYGLTHNIFAAKKLIMIGAAGVPQSKSVRTISYLVLAKFGRLVATVLPGAARQSLRRRLYTAAGATDYMDAGEMQSIASNVINEDARKYAAKIRARTLMLYGQDDTETPASYGEIFKHLIPNSQLFVVPDAGHFLHQDQPKLIERKLLEFLK